MLLITNIIMEILSTQKTLAVVKNEAFKALVLKISLVVISSLSTAIMIGTPINHDLLLRIAIIGGGTGIGSLIASAIRRDKIRTYKFIIKVADRASANKCMGELTKNNIDASFIGGRTIVAYSYSKEESATLKTIVGNLDTLFVEVTPVVELLQEGV